MHRTQESRLRWIRLDLPTKPSDREIDRARRRPVHDFPHLAQQLVAMNDTVAALRQIAQDLALAMRQMKGRRAAAGGVGFEVDLDVPEPASSDDGHRTSQYGIDPCRQLLYVDRL